MNTSLRKLKLSFLAMVYGWFACNFTMWLLAGCYELFTSGKSQLAFGDIMFFGGLVSGLVILGAWLLIFLPVDLLVRNDSWLRQPKVAAFAGFACAFLLVLLYFTILLLLNPGFPTSTGTFLLAIVLAGTTGTVSAYVRARMDKPKPTAMP